MIMANKKQNPVKLLTVKKEFTHQKAGKFIVDIKATLKKGTPVEINLAEIESVDLTSLQLLVAAKRSFENANIPFQLNFSGSNEIYTLIKNCGFEKITEPNPVS
jgi:ABC-type transporter Mla MlaB component